MRIEAAASPGADRDAWLDLWVAAWSAAMPSIDFAARRAWFADHLAGLLRDGATLLAARTDDGALAGFATVHMATGDLDQLVVARERQGRGVARALLAEAKRRRPEGLTLAVNADNGRALGLYAAAGFAVTGAAVNPLSGLPVRLMAWRPAP